MIATNVQYSSNGLSSGEGSAAVSTSFPTTGAEAAAVFSFSCLVDDRNGKRDQQRDSALNGDGGKGNERGSAAAGRRHQNSMMMEVEAMVEALAVTGEEGIYLGG